MDFVTCSACGEENPPNTPHCLKCGASLRDAPTTHGLDAGPSSVQQNLLHELKDGSLSYTRIDAANQLGALTESNEQIITALMAARAADDDPDVRAAAARALEAPAHRAVKQQLPDASSKASTQIRDYSHGETSMNRGPNFVAALPWYILSIVALCLFLVGSAVHSGGSSGSNSGSSNSGSSWLFVGNGGGWNSNDSSGGSSGGSSWDSGSSGDSGGWDSGGGDSGSWGGGDSGGGDSGSW